MPGSTHHQVLIVGGGTAGITVAAILKRRAPGVDIAIVEPSPDHYYQPALTLVGAGVCVVWFLAVLRRLGLRLRFSAA